MESLFASIAREWHVITQAPLSFFGILIALAVAAYGAAAWRFGRKMDGLEATNASLRERIQLRDDRATEYERKLQGASPDQAKAEIDELKQKLAALQPPRISADQSGQIVAIAAKLPAEIQVVYDGSDPHSANLARDFAEAFGRAGWGASMLNNMGQGGPPRLLALIAQPGDSANSAIDALHAAGVDFDVQRGRALTFGRPRPHLVLELRLPLHR